MKSTTRRPELPPAARTSRDIGRTNRAVGRDVPVDGADAGGVLHQLQPFLVGAHGFRGQCSASARRSSSTEAARNAAVTSLTSPTLERVPAGCRPSPSSRAWTTRSRIGAEIRRDSRQPSQRDRHSATATRPPSQPIAQTPGARSIDLRHGRRKRPIPTAANGHKSRRSRPLRATCRSRPLPRRHRVHERRVRGSDETAEIDVAPDQSSVAAHHSRDPTIRKPRRQDFGDMLRR